MVELETLRQAAAAAAPAALSANLVAGLVFSFNPVAFAAIPVSLAYVTRSRTRRQAATYALAFALGMVLTHVALGAGAGLAGDGLQRVLGRAWGVLLGPLLIVLGLVWIGWLPLRLPQRGSRAGPASGIWSAFALGVPFAVAVCPVCTPVLAVLLGAVAGLGSPGFGAALLFAFAFGRAVPILIGAFALGWLEHLKPLARLQRPLEIAGGVLLVASGLYMLNAYSVLIPALAG